MARRSFEGDSLSDEELVAIGGRSKTAGNGRLFGGLFVVAALTFATGYYVPLHRTHEALLKDYASLSERTTAAEKALAQARTDLQVATAHSEQLSLERTSASSSEQERAARLKTLRAALKSKLPEQVGKGQLSVGLGNDRVVVTLNGVVGQSRGHVDVAPAVSALCDAAGSVQPTAFVVNVVAYGARSPKAPGASAWDAAGASAAAVADALADKCKFPGDRLRTTTRLTPDSAGAEAGSRVDLEIEAARPVAPPS